MCEEFPATMNFDFFEFSNDMLCLADGRGFFKRLNQSWTRTLGWTSDELKSRPYIDFVHPEDVDATLREAALLGTGQHETIRFENRYRCKNGSYRWLMWRTTVEPTTGLYVAAARDITELKEQAALLKKQEQRFRDIYDQSPLGIAVIDSRNGRFLDINLSGQKIIGRSHPEMLERSFAEIIHPNDVQPDVEQMSLLLRGDRRHFQMESQLQRGDGSYLWVNLTVVAMWHPGDEPTRHIAMFEDIQARKANEDALRVAEAYFRQLATKAPVGIYQTDHSGNCIFVNQEWCEIAGTTPDDAMGDRWARFIHPEDRQRVFDLWTKSVHQGTPFRADYRFQTSSGDVRDVIGSATRIYSPDGKSMGYVGTVMDVTRRKSAEFALQIKQSQLRGILDHTSAMVYLKDLSGHYILVNRSLESLYGHEGQSILGKTDFECFPESVAQVSLESDRNVINHGVPLEFEEVIPSGGKLRIFRSVKFPVLDEGGRVIAVGGILTDVTDLVQANEQLRKEQELLRNLLDVQEQERQFLCHEFHDGLIQYAVGSLMLLEGFRGNQIPTKQSLPIDDAISNLRKGVEDGRRVIRGIRPSVLDDMGVEAAIHDLIDLFSQSEIETTFQHDCIGRLPRSVETATYRVVQEALNNARKHSNTRLIHVTMHKQGQALFLEVADFGLGFDVDAARKRGFGLLGMTERVRLLHGECQIYSEPGKGTRVCVKLPIRDDQDANTTFS